jgi:hypothetical protein
MLQILHLYFEMRIKLFSPPENSIHNMTAIEPTPRPQVQHVGPICLLESSRTVPELCKIHTRLRAHIIVVNRQALHQTNGKEQR